VRHGRPTRSKDFADVVASSNGWQVKRGYAQTTMTWKRIAVAETDAEMVRESRTDPIARQLLGNHIIARCNGHLWESFKIHGLQAMGYCRLIVDGRMACYFERELCTNNTTPLFQHEDFEWIWSNRSVLHGKHRNSGERWFGWNGVRSDNQLHFVGERCWWPTDDDHSIRFSIPDEFTLSEFLARCSLHSSHQGDLSFADTSGDDLLQ